MAIRLQPAFPEAYYNLGRVLETQKQNAEAASAFQLALRYNPNFNAAREALKRLGATP